MKNNWINTGGIGLVILMLGWGGNKGFEKMDQLNTASIKTSEEVSNLKEQVSGLSQQVGLMATRDLLKSELDKRDRTIDQLQQEIYSLHQQLSVP